MLTDVGDVPVQEIRDCGVDDDRLMNVISESVKSVMEEVSDFVSLEVIWTILCRDLFIHSVALASCSYSCGHLLSLSWTCLFS